MQQSNLIFGSLIIAFLIFITAKGKLPRYISLLRGSSSTGDNAMGGGATPGATAPPSTTSQKSITQEEAPRRNTILDTGKMSMDNALKLQTLYPDYVN